MPGFELGEKFARRSDPSLSDVLQALTDAFLRIRVSSDIQQAPIGFGVLYNGGGLSLYG